MVAAGINASAVESEANTTALKPLRLSKALRSHADLPRSGLAEKALRIFSLADSDNDELATLPQLRSALRKLQILPLLEHQLIDFLHELDLEGYGYGFCYEVPWNVFCDGFCGYFARLRNEIRAAENRFIAFDFGQQRVVTPHAARAAQARAGVNRHACASAGPSFPQLSGRPHRAITRLSSEMLRSYDAFDRPFPNLPSSGRAPKLTELQRKHRAQRRGPAGSHQRPLTSPAADDASRLPAMRHMGPLPRTPAFCSSNYTSLGRLAAAHAGSGARAAPYLRAQECR